MSEAHNNPIVSTGRGGQGNIGRDPHKYVDGSVHREGVVGQSAEGDYSAGRGGAGGIVHSPKVGPTGRRGSQDIIPDINAVPKAHENVHTGRGGSGNVIKDTTHKVEGKSEHHKESIIDKAKHLLHHDKKDGAPAS